MTTFTKKPKSIPLPGEVMLQKNGGGVHHQHFVVAATSWPTMPGRDLKKESEIVLRSFDTLTKKIKRGSDEIRVSLEIFRKGFVPTGDRI